MSLDAAVVKKIIELVRERPVDRAFINQDALDVRSRARTSAFPWRGQFTPGLVETLLDAYGSSGSVVLDPFAGSGTTLLEGARRGLRTIGVEVNPAAAELARVLELVSMPVRTREDFLARLGEVLEPMLRQGMGGLLADLGAPAYPDPLQHVVSLYQRQPDLRLRNLIAVTLMLGMRDGHELELTDLAKAQAQVRKVVRSLPDEPVACTALTGDARDLPLDDSVVDVAITSPPYINVFNYHQNYRPAIEALGWRALLAAKTEIGSNRKHRANRFLTVIQYAIDMAQVLREIHRVMRPQGRLVIVMGRESRVRGVAFANGDILASLTEIIGGWEYERWQERSFVNRFGKTIFEEILTFRAQKETMVLEGGDLLEAGRMVGVSMLTDSRSRASADVYADIDAAIAEADDVRPSPPLQIS